MKIKSFYLRWAIRLSFLAGAVGLTLNGPLPPALARLFPGASPLTWLASTLAGRGPLAGAWWALPALAVLLLALWRGRWFCRWFCPAGTLYGLGVPLSLKRTLPAWRANGFLFWMILAGAAVGITSGLGLGLDPLSSFNRLPSLLAPAAREGFAWIPGLVVPLFLLAGLVWPAFWCARFCPLGYAFDLTFALSHRQFTGSVRPDHVRRDLLVGAAIGLPLAGLLRWLSFRNRLTAEDPRAFTPAAILPPGAGTAERFDRLCTRCYACVHTCITGVIRVPAPDWRNPAAAFSPRLDFSKAFCTQNCNRCTQACPTGALPPLTEAAKQQVRLGTAVVFKEKCLAWADGEHCMVCQEMCPYVAISISESPTGIPRPVVDPAICRGCGFCENQCPAARAGKAILVRGIPRQEQIPNA